MSYAPITAAGVDRAAPLDMDTTRSERQANIQVEFAPDGVHVRIEWTGPVSGIAAAIERLKQSGIPELVRRGRAAPTPAPAAVEKFCPIHGDPMKPMSRPDKSGYTHWCTKKVGDGFCKERA